MIDRAALERLDAADPLAPRRELFALPANVIYLDGNSLGPLTHAARERIKQVVETEWGRDLITSWNAHGWSNLPVTVGAKIAPLIGARSDEVVCCDSTSVNLFKVLTGALAMRPGRCVVLTDADNFPTDLYVAQGLRSAGVEVRALLVSDIESALNEQVAAVMLTQVNYRTGQLHDMTAITRAAQAHGALMIWDLAHSAGAMPVELNACNADLAVGCGYKYLNGGPGAPAFAFVAARHHAAFQPVIAGWFGHAAPFDFASEFVPAPDARKLLVGTPPVLGMAALDAALDAFAGIDMNEVREKSVALTSAFIELVNSRCADLGLELVTPREADKRGSQVCLAHEHAYAVMQALIARGVVGDFRQPNILRFGFAPLYVRHVDVWDAVEVLREVLTSRAWDRPEFRQRKQVT